LPRPKRPSEDRRRDDRSGYVVAIAIVDENTDLVAAHRMDGCRPRWMKVSLRKAHTSCVMDRTTENFGEEIIRRQLQISYYGDPLFTALPAAFRSSQRRLDHRWHRRNRPDKNDRRRPRRHRPQLLRRRQNVAALVRGV